MALLNFLSLFNMSTLYRLALPKVCEAYKILSICYFIIMLYNRYTNTSGNIIVILMSCRYHGYPWPSLATSPYRSSPLAGLQDHIPYPHRAAVCMFELVVLLLPGHMWGSIGVHHLWLRPCFFSSELRVWFV